MANKAQSIFLLLGIVFLVFIFGMNTFINATIERERRREVRNYYLPRAFAVPTAPGTEKQHLTSEDPAKYNVGVQKEHTAFSDQNQWDFATRRMLARSRILEKTEERKTLQGLSKTPKEFQLQLKRIDERIRFYRSQKKGDSKNLDWERKLQNLYMMRSVLTVLKDKILSGSDGP